MGKTRDLFKKTRATKGTFHAKISTIKDRNGMDITEAEDIKKRWQEYWSGLPCLPPGDLPDSGIKSASLASVLAGSFFNMTPPWKAPLWGPPPGYSQDDSMSSIKEDLFLSQFTGST